MRTGRVLMLLFVCFFLLPIKATVAEDAASVTVGEKVDWYSDVEQALNDWNNYAEPATLTLYKDYAQNVFTYGDIMTLLMQKY